MVMRIVALLLALTTGCSWMSSRPVRHYPNGSVDCSTGKAAPTVDVLMATAFGIGGVAAAADSGAAALLPLGIATVYAISASHGFKQAGQCRDAIEQLAMQDDSEPEVGRSHWVAPSESSVSRATDGEAATDGETPTAEVKAKVDLEIDASELEP